MRHGSLETKWRRLGGVGSEHADPARLDLAGATTPGRDIHDFEQTLAHRLANQWVIGDLNIAARQVLWAGCGVGKTAPNRSSVITRTIGVAASCRRAPGPG